jgi:hypothetical protein
MINRNERKERNERNERKERNERNERKERNNSIIENITILYRILL